MEVLQTSALPLGYAAISIQKPVYQISLLLLEACQAKQLYSSGKYAKNCFKMEWSRLMVEE